MRIFEFDIDSGQILVNDQWYTAEQLSQIIKDKLTQGDFKISLYSEALERLVGVMQNAREVKVLVAKDVADSYDRLAAARQVTVEKVIREVLMNYLTSDEATAVLFGEAAAPAAEGGGDGEEVIELQKKKG